MDFIADHPEYNWDWKHISYNPNLIMEFIEGSHSEYDWDWYEVSSNPNVTIEFIEGSS